MAVITSFLCSELKIVRSLWKIVEEGNRGKRRCNDEYGIKFGNS